MRARSCRSVPASGPSLARLSTHASRRLRLLPAGVSDWLASGRAELRLHSTPTAASASFRAALLLMGEAAACWHRYAIRSDSKFFSSASWYLQACETLPDNGAATDGMPADTESCLGCYSSVSRPYLAQCISVKRDLAAGLSLSRLLPR